MSGDNGHKGNAPTMPFDMHSSENLIMLEGINKAVPIGDSNVNSLSATVQYSKAVFEGAKFVLIKAPGSSLYRIAFFHPFDNYERMRDSVAALGDAFPSYTNEQLIIAATSLVFMNRWDENWPAKITEGEETKASMLYVRPFAHAKTNYSIGIYQKCEMEVSTTVLPLFSYLGKSAEENGAKVLLFSEPRSAPYPQFKASANYPQNMMAKRLSVEEYGCDEVLFLRPNQEDMANICEKEIIETSGQTPAIYKEQASGKMELILPPFEHGRLDGITMQAVARIARKHGIEVVERLILVQDILDSDCFFLTGNATGAVRIGTLVMAIDRKPRPIGTSKGNEFFEHIIKTEFLGKVLSEGSEEYGRLMVYTDECFTERHIDYLKSIADELGDRAAAVKLAVQKMTGLGCVRADVSAWYELKEPGLRPNALAGLRTDKLYARKLHDVAKAASPII
ncbi:MAG: aminotransferase class IV [Candidatus Burarchaeum sp.]|nr:aminotransferase class IV [Candidatus Burarchaeum sp.]MDO8340158.1 aminotransferase class IV [Candidatus Burarchaeum sp.]